MAGLHNCILRLLLVVGFHIVRMPHNRFLHGLRSIHDMVPHIMSRLFSMDLRILVLNCSMRLCIVRDRASSILRIAPGFFYMPLYLVGYA